MLPNLLEAEDQGQNIIKDKVTSRSFIPLPKTTIFDQTLSEKEIKHAFDAEFYHTFYIFVLQRRRIGDELPSTMKNVEVNLHQRDSSSHFSYSDKLGAKLKYVQTTFNN